MTNQFYHLLPAELRTSTKVDEGFKTTFFIYYLRKAKIDKNRLFIGITEANVTRLNVAVDDVTAGHLPKHCF